MPMRREQVAAALKYLGDKADLRGRFERATSLDPQEQDLADIAVEGVASLAPGVGPALAARDFERARRADDKAGMAMAAASAIPVNRLIGALKGFDPVMREIDVYHGTPHRFPSTEANPLGEFDASKINTGEGAQAYGHGIYLAESPKVAEGYKKRLAGASYIKDSQSVPYGKIWQKAADAALATGAAHPDYSRAISDHLMDWVNRGRKPETFLRYNRVPTTAKPAYEAAVKEYVGLQKTPGNLYTADLPDEMVDRMLDWDKPLSEQPAAVRNAFNDLLDETGNYQSSGIGGTGNLSGSDAADLYNDLKGMWNENYGPDDLVNIDAPSASAAVSEFLRRRGILGIKYADAGSRGQGGSGTRNFVVFPGEEKKVRILERK